MFCIYFCIQLCNPLFCNPQPRPRPHLFFSNFSLPQLFHYHNYFIISIIVILTLNIQLHYSLFILFFAKMKTGHFILLFTLPSVYLAATIVKIFTLYIYIPIYIYIYTYLYIWFKILPVLYSKKMEGAHLSSLMCMWLRSFLCFNILYI